MTPERIKELRGLLEEWQAQPRPSSVAPVLLMRAGVYA